jgi:hypothetical protein
MPRDPLSFRRWRQGFAFSNGVGFGIHACSPFLQIRHPLLQKKNGYLSLTALSKLARYLFHSGPGGNELEE